MQAPLGMSVQLRKPGATHLPYLLLNSTMVESGERAIASEIRIRPRDFPGARDQRDELGADLKLSTAAHNAARFPFVNALGSARRVDGEPCRHAAAAGPSASVPASAAAGGTRPPCLRLADGGYFDNSGAQTSQDVVRALHRLLRDQAGVPEADRPWLAWLAQRLVLTAVFIRNGVETEEQRMQCQPDEPGYDPDRPVCRSALKLYADLAGPLVTAVNAGGIGASGRLAESRLKHVVDDFNLRTPALKTAVADAAVRPMCAIELPQSDVLYPLGWSLSPQAAQRMAQEADNAKLYACLHSGKAGKPGPLETYATARYP